MVKILRWPYWSCHVPIAMRRRPRDDWQCRCDELTMSTWRLTMSMRFLILIPQFCTCKASMCMLIAAGAVLLAIGQAESANYNYSELSYVSAKLYRGRFRGARGHVPHSQQLIGASLSDSHTCQTASPAIYDLSIVRHSVNKVPPRSNSLDSFNFSNVITFTFK